MFLNHIVHHRAQPGVYLRLNSEALPAACGRLTSGWVSERTRSNSPPRRQRGLPPETRIRFGYRRLRVLLLREGWEVGNERFYRVYIEEGLALRRKRPWDTRPGCIASTVCFSTKLQ